MDLRWAYKAAAGRLIPAGSEGENNERRLTHEKQAGID